jgi:hypothetical protein
MYHTVPDKAAALESFFRDAAKLQTKHNLDVIGYNVDEVYMRPTDFSAMR